MLLDVLRIADEVGSRTLVQSAVDVAIGLAASLGQDARAMRWHGAADAMASETGFQRDPADQAFVDQAVVTAQARLSADELATERFAGNGMHPTVLATDLRAWLRDLADVAVGQKAAVVGR